MGGALRIAARLPSNESDKDMMQEYPTSLDPEVFANPATRRRLSGTAIKAVVRLIAAWQADERQGAALLAVSPNVWRLMQAGTWKGTLSQDQLTRASVLIGIYRTLHRLFANDMADRWPGLVNHGPRFGGQSPIAAMIAGGIPLMLATRRHLEDLRGI